jgi:hypothetical protein
MKTYANIIICIVLYVMPLHGQTQQTHMSAFSIGLDRAPILFQPEKFKKFNRQYYSHLVLKYQNRKGYYTKARLAMRFSNSKELEGLARSFGEIRFAFSEIGLGKVKKTDRSTFHYGVVGVYEIIRVQNGVKIPDGYDRLAGIIDNNNSLEYFGAGIVAGYSFLITPQFSLTFESQLLRFWTIEKEFLEVKMYSLLPSEVVKDVTRRKNFALVNPIALGISYSIGTADTKKKEMNVDKSKSFEIGIDLLGPQDTVIVLGPVNKYVFFPRALIMKYGMNNNWKLRTRFSYKRQKNFRIDGYYSQHPDYTVDEIDLDLKQITIAVGLEKVIAKSKYLSFLVGTEIYLNHLKNNDYVSFSAADGDYENQSHHTIRDFRLRFLAAFDIHFSKNISISLEGGYYTGLQFNDAYGELWWFDPQGVRPLLVETSSATYDRIWSHVLRPLSSVNLIYSF